MYIELLYDILEFNFQKWRAIMLALLHRKGEKPK